MMTFKYIEDYILWIAGITNKTGSVHLLPAIARTMESAKLALAHYDVSFIYSVAEQISAGTSLTDKQYALAKQLVTKYKRQLAKHGIGVPEEELPSQLGIRTIDRARSVWIGADDMIKVRYPYNNSMVDSFRVAAKDNNGLVAWNADEKVWQMAITESNVSWIMVYAALNKFEVEEGVIELFESIAVLEQTPYKIELERINGEFVISNAASSLLEFVEPFKDKKDILIDYAPVLGYTVSEELIDELTKEKGKEFVHFCKSRVINVNPAKVRMKKIVDWAREVNRLPVIVYDPTIRIDDEEKNLTSAGEIYYTNKIDDVSNKLIVTTSSLIFGQKKEWVDRFQKVIFYCDKLTK